MTKSEKLTIARIAKIEARVHAAHIGLTGVAQIADLAKYGEAVAMAVIEAGRKALCNFCRDGHASHDIRPYGVEGLVVPFLHDVNGEPQPCFAGHLRALVAQGTGREKGR